MKKKSRVRGVAGELETVEHCNRIFPSSIKIVKAKQLCSILFESPSHELSNEWSIAQIAPLFVVI